MTSRGGKEKPMILLGFVNYPLLSLPVLRCRNMRPHFHTWIGYHRELNPNENLWDINEKTLAVTVFHHKYQEIARWEKIM